MTIRSHLGQHTATHQQQREGKKSERRERNDVVQNTEETIKVKWSGVYHSDKFRATL